jgi:O-antigen ligase
MEMTKTIFKIEMLFIAFFSEKLYIITTMQKIFFRILSIIFIGGLVPIVFSTNWQDQPVFFALVVISGILFFIASIDLKKALGITLLFLPGFFLLDNFNEISTTFQIGSTSDLMQKLSSDAKSVGFLLCAIFSIAIITKQRKEIKNIPLFLTLPFSVLLLCVSFFWAPNQDLALAQVIFYIFLLCSYFIAFLFIKKPADFYVFIFILLGYATLTLILSYYQLFSGLLYLHEDSSITRLSGPFAQPNPFGNYLYLMISLTMICLFSLREKSGQIKQYLLIFLVLAAPIFILTLSRSSWIALAVFLVVFFSKQKKKNIIIMFLLGTLVMLTLLMFDATKERIQGIYQHSMFDSVYARREVWSLAYKKFKSQPFLGYGAGNFQEIIKDAKETDSGTARAHNDIVFFAIEGGLLAIAGYAIFIAGFASQLIKAFRLAKIKPKLEIKILQNNAQISLNVIATGLIAIIVSVLVLGAAESHFEANIFQIFIWSLFGCSFSMFQKIDKLSITT